jgi:hypothetical protein
VADMFFEGDGAVDKAVRLVIFIIMLVFDPLAVLLLIAANISMRKPEETQPVEKTWDDFFKSTPIPEDSIEIEKENIVDIEEKEEEPIVIDGTSGESIPPISKRKRGFPNRKSKIDSMYVDDAELAFRKKEK